MFDKLFHVLLFTCWDETELSRDLKLPVSSTLLFATEELREKELTDLRELHLDPIDEKAGVDGGVVNK